jgi:hypothetical protein
MTDNENKNPPSEKPDGNFHFNPGNMSGKKIGEAKPKAAVDGESPSHDKPSGNSTDGLSATRK